MTRLILTIPAAQNELRTTLRPFAAAVCVVTHNHVEAMVTRNRIAVMGGGAIVKQDAPELYRRPKSECVAEFPDDMDFVPAEVTSQTSDWGRVSSPRGTLEEPDHETRAAGDKVRIVSHSDDVRAEPQDGAATFQAQIADRFYLGASILPESDAQSHSEMVHLHNSRQLQDGKAIALSVAMQNFCSFAYQSPPIS